jgi:hypothetical protein
MSASGRTHEPHSELHRRRDELAEQVAELQWNLGGLAYEMAIRDHFRLDVLMRRAAMLQERDAELAEVDRLLHMQQSAVAGNCASCGAVRSRGAVFCWQCGAQVMERSIVSGGGGSELDAPTVEIETKRDEQQRAIVESVQTPGVAEHELGRPIQASS